MAKHARTHTRRDRKKGRGSAAKYKQATARCGQLLLLLRCSGGEGLGRASDRGPPFFARGLCLSARFVMRLSMGMKHEA